MDFLITQFPHTKYNLSDALRLKGKVYIGESNQCDICLEGMSERLHAKIKREEDGPIFLENMVTANGSPIKVIRVNQPTPILLQGASRPLELKNGDEMYFEGSDKPLIYEERK